MVAVPTLAGAVLRIVNGLLVDRIGPKMTGAIGQLIVMAGLGIAWAFGVDSFAGTIALGIILGFAGASFAVALPLASRWYPAEHQGTALGIAGMGNSGTVLAALFAPGLARMFGWNAVFGLAVIPLAITFLIYMALAKDAPDAPAPRPLAAYLEPLRQADAWWFMFFYGVTFGGFVGLAASLSIYFTDQFGLTPVVAGYCTAACVFAGSMVRPMGGALADRIGGTRTLSLVFALAAVTLATISTGPASIAMALALFVVAMLALGAGNGAVFQLVPQRFRNEIGVMTGLVGCAGGVGGFYLASSLGLAKQLHGQPAMGLPDLRGPRLRGARQPDPRQAALADDLGRGAHRGAHLMRRGTVASRSCSGMAAAASPFRPPFRPGGDDMTHPIKREHLVVIGNGMAGCRAVEEILARDPARFRITIFGAEPRVNYNRIMLSPLLAGEKSFDEIVINDAAWYDDNGIALVAGDAVTAIDKAAKTVTAASGATTAYDKLLIATGSDPVIIPVPGRDLPGVVTFRDIDDVESCCAPPRPEATRW